MIWFLTGNLNSLNRNTRCDVLLDGVSGLPLKVQHIFRPRFSSVRPVMPFKTESCVRVSVHASVVSPPGLLPYSTCDICHFDMCWCPLELRRFYLLADLHILTPFCHPVRHKQTATVRLYPHSIPSRSLRSYGNPKIQGRVVFSRLVCEAGHVTFAQASVWFCQGRAVEVHWRVRGK